MTMSNEANHSPNQTSNPSSGLTLSRIARDLPPSGIRKFFDIAAQMQDVISLSVGEPDFATPWGHPRGRHLLLGARADDLHQQLRDI